MKEKKYLIIGAISVLILMLGFTFAYFAPIIRGEGKKISVRTGSLAIRFTDTQEITDEEITPGWKTSKSFTIENESNESYYYNINLKDVVNTFVTDDFLQYKITSTNGYNMDEFEPITKESLQVLGEGIEIAGLETQEYTIYFRYVDSPDIDQSEDMNKEFSGYLSITEGEAKTLAKILIKDNPTILTRTDFNNSFNEENIGVLYKATGNETEDGSDVYYFAGNAQNNWVKFGKDQNDADLYWRIIRTNEDGSIRLLYSGNRSISMPSSLIKINSYTGGYGDPIYNGYMYGSTGSLANNRINSINSSVKNEIDMWYNSGINNKTDGTFKYSSYVSETAIYCNDRSGDAWSTVKHYYAGYSRLYSNKPTYRCGFNMAGRYYIYSSSRDDFYWTSLAIGNFSDANKADKFSKSTSSGGNGKLIYPVALMTADEVLMAGGSSNSESLAWYYYDKTVGSATSTYMWWTMTPSYYTGGGSQGNPYIFVVNGSNENMGSKGQITSRASNDTKYVATRPVLSLKSCVKYVSGDGSSDAPYEVKIDTTCASNEN